MCIPNFNGLGRSVVGEVFLLGYFCGFPQENSSVKNTFVNEIGSLTEKQDMP